MISAFFASTLNRVFAGIALALLIALSACWIGWNHAADARDKARDDLRTAKAQIALLNTDAALKETASQERQADTVTAAKLEKDLVDAIKAIPDTVPDAVRVRLGCERLRKAGYIDANLPAACGSPG